MSMPFSQDWAYSYMPLPSFYAGAGYLTKVTLFSWQALYKLTISVARVCVLQNFYYVDAMHTTLQLCIIDKSKQL